MRATIRSCSDARSTPAQSQPGFDRPYWVPEVDFVLARGPRLAAVEAKSGVRYARIGRRRFQLS